MATVDVVNLNNQKVSAIDLPDFVFKAKVNEPLVLQVIRAQLASRRQGTASTKCKSEVRGGGKKPFKQKGTGNARQGSSRSPLMPGGGATFGPKPRDYTQRTPREILKGSLRCVLSDKLASERLLVIDSLQLETPKTKMLNEILSKNFKITKALLVDSKNRNLSLASRNLPTVRYLATNSINTYDLVKYEWLFLSKESALELSKNLDSKISGGFAGA